MSELGARKGQTGIIASTLVAVQVHWHIGTQNTMESLTAVNYVSIEFKASEKLSAFVSCFGWVSNKRKDLHVTLRVKMIVFQRERNPFACANWGHFGNIFIGFFSFVFLVRTFPEIRYFKIWSVKFGLLLKPHLTAACQKFILTYAVVRTVIPRKYLLRTG